MDKKDLHAVMGQISPLWPLGPESKLVFKGSAAQRGPSPLLKGSVRIETPLCAPRRADPRFRGRGNRSSVLGVTLAHQLMGSLTQKTL